MVLLYIFWAVFAVVLLKVYFNPGYKNSDQMVKRYPSHRESPTKAKPVDRSEMS